MASEELLYTVVHDSYDLLLWYFNLIFGGHYLLLLYGKEQCKQTSCLNFPFVFNRRMKAMWVNDDRPFISRLISIK